MRQGTTARPRAGRARPRWNSSLPGAARGAFFSRFSFYVRESPPASSRRSKVSFVLRTLGARTRQTLPHNPLPRPPTVTRCVPGLEQSLSEIPDRAQLDRTTHARIVVSRSGNCRLLWAGAIPALFLVIFLALCMMRYFRVIFPRCSCVILARLILALASCVVRTLSPPVLKKRATRSKRSGMWDRLSSKWARASQRWAISGAQLVALFWLC